MIATEPTFLETLSPATRKALVLGRLFAMRGLLRKSCDLLKASIASISPEKNSDLAALGMLKSEILHLDGQETDAISVYKEFVEPHLSSLSVAAQLVAENNLSCLQMAAWHPDAVSEFYHLVDRRRIAQVEPIESETLLDAQSSIEGERFAEALQLLWQNLQRAYALGSWRALSRASERLAKLYLRVGALEVAFHFLIVAEADKEMEHLAAETSRRSDPAIIRSILKRMMDFANLRRHFTVACKFVSKIPDLIPDIDLECLAEWLLPRCSETADFNGGGAMRSAWEAVRELGHRLPKDTSRKLIAAALSHPEWQAPLPGENRVLPNRKVIVEALTFLAHSAPKDYLPKIVEGTLPLATERAQDYDYGEVVNLLCNLSKLGDHSLRERIKSVLYVPGKSVNRVLAQVGGIFGVEALTPPQWEEFANKLIEETRHTVQRLNPGETPKRVDETLMVMTQTTPTGQLQVIVHGVVGLEALAMGKQHLCDSTIERVMRVLAEMATNPDNVLSNREMLLSQMYGFADRVQPKLRDELVSILEPLARGKVPESKDYPSATTGPQPLATAPINMGTPQQVQAMALVVAATLCGSDTARSRLISESLFEGFVSPHVVVRKGAYGAARRLPELSSEQLLPILMGLRDPDPKAAVAAFAAFAERLEWYMTRPMWKLFLLAIRLASQSPDSNLRRHAALALRARLEAAPTEATRYEAGAIMEVFSGDVAYSVRQAVTG